MLLRATSLIQANGGNIEIIADKSKADQCSVSHAAPLIDFCDAVVSRNPQQIQATRDELLKATSPAAVVDVAGVIGNFQRMNRIADAGGAEVDPQVQLLTADLRDELRLDDLSSAPAIRPAGVLKKLIARIAIPLAAMYYAKLRR